MSLGEVIQEALRERLGERKLICVLCGGTRWFMEGGISNIPVQDRIGGGLIIGGKAMPLTTLICEVCGYTILLNILKLVGKKKLEAIIRESKTDQMIEEVLKERGNG